MLACSSSAISRAVLRRVNAMGPIYVVAPSRALVIVPGARALWYPGGYLASTHYRLEASGPMANRKRKAINSTPVPGNGTGAAAVVGIGASAGGLAALQQLLTHVPSDSSLAWVVVVHLPPDLESHLPQLLQPYTNLPVTQVSETISIDPDHVYVIPPGSNLEAIDSHLRLAGMERHQQRRPIDHFFSTIADTYDGSAIGVVLTGTGTDGAIGIRSIKEG